MGVYEGRGTLGKAMKQLENRWLDAKMTWVDARSHEFEQRFLVPLEAELRNAVAAMDHMATLLSKIHQECE